MQDYSGYFVIRRELYSPYPHPKYNRELENHTWYTITDCVHELREKRPISAAEFDAEPRCMIHSQYWPALQKTDVRIIIKNDLEHRYRRLTEDVYTHIHHTLNMSEINPKHVFYITSNLHEHRVYAAWAEKNHIPDSQRIHALGVFGWSEFSRVRYTEFDHSWLTRPKTKKYVCFNRRMHLAPHRHLALYHLQRLGEIDQGFVSNPVTYEREYINQYALCADTYTNSGVQRTLDTKRDLGAGGSADLRPWKLYRDSNFSIVTESEYSTENSTMRFYTEKTARAILYGHPFVIIGECGANTDLAQLGCEPYTELFDMSTDLIPNMHQRICSQFDSIRFDWEPGEIVQLLRDKIAHNRNSILEDRYNQRAAKKLIRLANEV